jgi:hypothetical protein
METKQLKEFIEKEAEVKLNLEECGHEIFE